MHSNTTINSDVSISSQSGDYVGAEEKGDIEANERQRNADISTFFKALKIVGINYIPNALSRVVNMFNGPASTFILSQYDSRLLPVSSLASAEQLLLVTIPSMLIYGSSSVIGRICGAAIEGDESQKMVGGIVHSSVLSSLALCVPIIIAISYSEPILLAVGQTPGNVSLVQEYFNTYRWGVPALFLTISAQQLSVGVKRPLISFTSTALNALITNALGYAFVNGYMKDFSKGIQGMGTANAIANWIVLAGLLTYYRFNSDFSKYKIFSSNEIKIILKGVRDVLKVGGPLALSVGAEISTLACITLLAGRFGNEQLSAHQVASQVFTLYLGMSIGLTQTASALISYEHGAKNLNNIKKLSRAALTISLLPSLIMASSFSIFSSSLCSIFLSSDPAFHSQEIIEISKKLILIDAIGQPADFLRNCSIGILRGRGSNWMPMVVNILLLYSMTFSFSYMSNIKDDEGLYIGRSIGMYLSAIALLMIVHVKNRFISNETNIPANVTGCLSKIGIFSNRFRGEQQNNQNERSALITSYSSSS